MKIRYIKTNEKLKCQIQQICIFNTYIFKLSNIIIKYNCIKYSSCFRITNACINR